MISIHAPREGRDVFGAVVLRMLIHFNPRAPRGARHKIFRRTAAHSKFQSTRPARGATIPARNFIRTANISIHAPREGRDSTM